ncbi:hypothetical protein [Corynebacterium mustelae]|nr:hypothetical protein [Corynebacterium mustelae]
MDGDFGAVNLDWGRRGNARFKLTVAVKKILSRFSSLIEKESITTPEVPLQKKRLRKYLFSGTFVRSNFPNFYFWQKIKIKKKIAQALILVSDTF